MKLIEEKFLKSSIEQLNNYAKDNCGFLDFFNKIDSILPQSLQEQSFKEDLNFLNDVGFILSVITSIISKPHIASTGEEIIIRSELAPALSNEMFQKTLRDSTLWTEEGMDMVPQYVHYYQHVDELKIYENIFIVYLINLISQELVKYNDFYLSILPTYNFGSDLIDKDDYQAKALAKIRLLNRRMKHIKGSYFYRIISKTNTKLRYVHPTNILVKDRLYNFCYKFYKKITSYDDEVEKNYDFRTYIYINLLKSLKKMDASILKFDSSKNELTPDFTCQVRNFSLNVSFEKDDSGILFEVINHHLNQNNISKHLLMMNTKNDTETLNVSKKGDYDTIESISLWNILMMDEKITKAFSQHECEEKIMSYYLLSKLQEQACSADLYTNYCPSCKHSDIEEIDNQYICETCGSKYTFFTKDNNEYLWFLKLRTKK